MYYQTALYLLVEIVVASIPSIMACLIGVLIPPPPELAVVVVIAGSSVALGSMHGFISAADQYSDAVLVTGNKSDGRIYWIVVCALKSSYVLIDSCVVTAAATTCGIISLILGSTKTSDMNEYGLCVYVAKINEVTIDGLHEAGAVSRTGCRNSTGVLLSLHWPLLSWVGTVGGVVIVIEGTGNVTLGSPIATSTTVKTAP